MDSLLDGYLQRYAECVLVRHSPFSSQKTPIQTGLTLSPERLESHFLCYTARRLPPVFSPILAFLGRKSTASTCPGYVHRCYPSGLV